MEKKEIRGHISVDMLHYKMVQVYAQETSQSVSAAVAQLIDFGYAPACLSRETLIDAKRASRDATTRLLEKQYKKEGDFHYNLCMSQVEEEKMREADLENQLKNTKPEDFLK
jgi:hypothetical protein